MPKIILTGGGTAGHVTPNLALAKPLKERGFEILYVGSHNGMEREMAENAGLRFEGVSVGKMRRYLNAKNFSDVFRVIKGVGEAVKIIRREKPDVIFSKGGFVPVPIIVAGGLCGVPIVAHESDLTPGLASKIAAVFAKAICVTFEETLPLVPKNKGFFTGAPIRPELLAGQRTKGLSLCNFTGQKPVLLIMGGSSGAVKINNCVSETIKKLTEKFDVVHLFGKGKLTENKLVGYCQFEYLSAELPDVLAAADLVVSRAGSNSIRELLLLKKPNLLIPLSKSASRGDQIVNADCFEKKGYSMVLKEEDMNAQTLLNKIWELYEKRQTYINKMTEHRELNSADEIIKIISRFV